MSLPDVKTLPTTSEYEVMRVHVDGKLLVVYTSGSVTYQSSSRIESILQGSVNELLTDTPTYQFDEHTEPHEAPQSNPELLKKDQAVRYIEYRDDDKSNLPIASTLPTENPEQNHKPKSSWEQEIQYPAQPQKELPLPNELLASESATLTECLANLDHLLDLNPYLRDRPGFEEQYRKAQWYITIKRLQQGDALQNMSYREIARRTSISNGTILRWIKDEEQSQLVRTLTIHERARRRLENSRPEAVLHRVNPSITYQFCKKLRDHPEQRSPERITESLSSMFFNRPSASRIVFLEFRPYHPHGPRWMRETAQLIETQRKAIEKHLNLRLNPSNADFSIRLGFTDKSLYIWHRNTDKFKWINHLAKEHFYFSSVDIKRYLVDNARKHLNTTDSGLSRLFIQFSERKSPPANPSAVVHELWRTKPHLTGESFHFLLDAIGYHFSDFEQFIKRVGRDTQGGERGGILNPRFPKGESYDELIARLSAIISSDGSINKKTGTLEYYEKSRDRIEYVKNLLRTKLGDVHIHEDQKPCGTYRLSVTVTLGRVLEQTGIPAGDKAVLQQRLNPRILNGSMRVKFAYLSELLPEDGNFSVKGNIGRFSWKRAVILDAGPKNEEYGFTPKIGTVHKNLILYYGTQKVERIRDGPVRKPTRITWNELKELCTRTDKPKDQQTALRLKQIIEQNQCLLIEDEKTLCESIGIKIGIAPRSIFLYENERVSVIWNATTTSVDGAKQWGIFAPPSSGRKRRAVKDWLKSRNEMEIQKRSKST